VGEEESEEEGSSEGEKRREGAEEEQYEDAREEQGGARRGRARSRDSRAKHRQGTQRQASPDPGAPSAESASLTTCGSSRYTSSVSMATAKGTLPGSANPVDQGRQKTGAGELQEGEGALHGARMGKGPAEKCLAGIGPASQQPLQAKAKAEAAGEPPGHPPSTAGSSKSKRQAGAAHPAPDPQSKRRRQAPQTGPGPSAPRLRGPPSSVRRGGCPCRAWGHRGRPGRGPRARPAAPGAPSAVRVAGGAAPGGPPARPPRVRQDHAGPRHRARGASALLRDLSARDRVGDVRWVYSTAVVL